MNPMLNVPYPNRIILIRHAESVGNIRSREEQRCFPVGTNKYGLSPRGREQARITGEWMREHYPAPDRIIFSYYARTNETVRIIYPDLPLREDALLAERDRGMWTNATEEEVQKLMPWEIRRRDEQGSYHYRPMGGENIPDVEQRVREFRRSIHSNYSEKTIVIVGHSQWILLWQKIVHGWSMEETMKRFDVQDWVANASVTIYSNKYDPQASKYVLEHNPGTDYIVPWKDQI
jgi:broad specificity phosphatase PhoE